jgi:hypothetical protein
MKKITEPKRVTAANAWGRDATCTHQEFQVETDDVGKTREHFLGYNHRSYTFHHHDIGRHINVQSSPGWTCWYFVLPG